MKTNFILTDKGYKCGQCGLTFNKREEAKAHLSVINKLGGICFRVLAPFVQKIAYKKLLA